MVDLGVLYNATGHVSQSNAAAINNSDVIVGSSDFNEGSITHAFIHTKGRMRDLNTLVVRGTGWELRAAAGINASGQIVGSGVVGDDEDTTRPFLLTPHNVPSPTIAVFKNKKVLHTTKRRPLLKGTTRGEVLTTVAGRPAFASHPAT